MTLRCVLATLLTIVLMGGCSDAFNSDRPVQGPAPKPDGEGMLDGKLGDSTPTLDLVSLDADLPQDVSPASGCGGGCPSGYVCFGTGPGSKCVPGPDFACAPCANSGTCLGGLCMGFGDGKGCLIPCLGTGESSSCPAGFSCDTGLCYPNSKSCSCGPGNDGQSRGCNAGNGGQGICGGTQSCDATNGWSVCTAQAATVETCDGLDDDCDGSTDEGLGGPPCGTGACAGKTICSAGVESCDGPSAVTEVCNGLDDDCDGATDEGYETSVDVKHCGSLCTVCSTSDPNATATCIQGNAGGPSSCSYPCKLGYFHGADGLCVAEATLLCAPCTLAEGQLSAPECGNLTVPGLCVGAGTSQGYCASECGEGFPACPGGFTCTPQGLAFRCLPISGDCTCTLAQAGLQKPCSNGGCTGTSTCDPVKGWSTCTAPAPSTEVCNGLDDDCNGSTDDVPGVGSACVIQNDAGVCAGKKGCNPQGLTCIAQIPAAETCNGLDDDCDGSIDDDVGAGLPCAVTNGFGTCSGVVVCAGAKGSSCNAKVPGAEVCNGLDDDCNGTTDDGWLDSSGGYTTPEACGSCANVCAKPAGSGAIATCTGGICGLACAPGQVDMDGNVGNGCECTFVSDLDEPDGVDQNCDGIDGDISQAIFVAKTGADGNPGTIDLPLASVQKALSLAEFQGKRDVYVAGGVYTGSVDLVAGVSLFGGYGPGFTQRDTVSHQTAIVGVAPAIGPSVAVKCSGINGAGPKTRIDGLTLLAANAKAAGESSYGLWSDGCDDRLQVTYLQIGAGDGAAGIAGLPGQNGAKGVDGTAGLKAKDIGHEGCTAQDATPGGKGGILQCGGSEASGGQGGTTVCPTYDEDNPTPMCPSFPYVQSVQPVEIGGKGAGPGGGSGGVPGADAYIDSYKGKVTQCQGNSSCNTCHVPVKQLYGDDGSQGAAGVMGGAGPGCTALQGKVIAGQWSPIPGGEGGFGKSGGGGGGGGAAGAIEVHDCSATSAGYSDLGGSGGGGGSGGCGGTGGTGGGSGGGSFALFVVAKSGGSLPILIGNTLSTGSGGSGGTGGPAGSGGAGGQGGVGGASGEDQTATFCTSKGGNGGAGGHGGHGGGGGGGCGGPSVWIAVSGAPAGTASLLQKQNQGKQLGQGGKGGSGGPSIGLPGLAGSGGLATAVLDL